MNKGLFWGLIALLFAWILLGAYFLGNHFCNGHDTAAIAPISKDTTTGYSPAFLAEDGTMVARTAENFRFPLSAKSYLPITEGLDSELTKISDYLQENSNRIMTISGEYREDEKNNSLAVDLGQGRASSIKEWFELNGVAGRQMLIDSEIVGKDHFVNDTLIGGISLTFSEVSTDGDARLDRILGELVGNPLTVYFGLDKNDLDLNQEQREQLADMIYFLDRAEGSNIEIGGHTDSTGDKRYNRKLSESRAAQVRDYIMKGGISESRMSVKGYGPDKPIEDNKYEAGRKLNRRVEIILNK